MAPSRNRTVRTQVDEDEDARSRWDALFVAKDVLSRALNRIEIGADRDSDSDAELSIASPVYDRCLRVQGPDRVLRMRNFAPIEFEKLWDLSEDHVLSNWGVGRGKKCKTSPKDVLFMMLAALKHCGNWETVSAMFDMDASGFQKMIKQYVDMYEPFLYAHLVKEPEVLWSMKKITVGGRAFENLPSARYATDVTFQHAARPTGNFHEVMKYFSGKHKLYGHKVEVSVLPTDVAINCTAFEPGAVSDIAMFRGNAEFHKYAMRKQQDEGVISDVGPGMDKFEGFWAVLVDKGYQGLGDEFRTIQPKKKSRGQRTLTPDEREQSDKITHDRVIVENYFGRMKTCWGVISHQWTWDRGSYNRFFRLCLALTNYSVQCAPLRREEGDIHLRHNARLVEIGEEIEVAKKRKREEYRDNRRARLQLSSRNAPWRRTASHQSHTRRTRVSSSQVGSPCSTVFGSP